MAHDFYDEIIEQMHNVMQNMAIKKLAFRILLPLVAGAIGEPMQTPWCRVNFQCSTKQGRISIQLREIVR